MAEYINKNRLKSDLLKLKDKVEPDTQWQEGYISAMDVARQVVGFQPIANVVEIPEGATIGDMIEAMFPNLKGKEKAFAIHLYVNKDKVGEVSMDWWNTPYEEMEE